MTHLNHETNDPPSPEEISVILTSIQAARASLSSIHSKLSQSPGAPVLFDQLQSCYGFIRRQRGVISALRFLPNEILSTIFVFACQQSETTLNAPNHISVIQLHISLSRVCRLWRDIVYQTPNLWVNIPTCGINDTISPQPNLQFIKTYIQRSGAAPLNISLRLRLSSSAEGTTDDWKSMLLVLSQVERWHDLDLTTSDEGLRYLYNQSEIHNHLAHLEVLTIRLPLTEVLSLDQTAHHDIFLNTPFLRSLRIAAQDHQSIGRVLGFPWSTLHSFQGILPIDAPLGSNFRCVSAVLHPFDNIKIKPKPGLRVLHIDPSIASPNFTLNRDFPDLEVLKLVNTSPAMLITSLRRMVANSAQIDKTESLKNLTIIEFSVPQVDQISMASFLEWTPRVTSLSLRNFQIYLLEVFSRTNPVVLPDLSSLVLEQQNSINPKIFAKLLTDVVVARKGAGLTIECHFPRPQCLNVLYALEGLQEFQKRELTGESLSLESYYEDLVRCVFGGSKDQRIKNADKRIEHFHTVWPHRWLMTDALMKAIEKHVLVDALNLEYSNLPNILTDIATIPAGLILEEDYFNFQQRAQDILRKWQPSLDFIRKDRKWVMNDGNESFLSYNTRTEAMKQNSSEE